MTAEEYYNQEMNLKPAQESCFKNLKGITYTCGEIDNDVIHAKDEMIAFAESYHKESSKELVEACKLALHFCVRRQMPNEHELEALSVDLKKALENHLK